MLAHPRSLPRRRATRCCLPMPPAHKLSSSLDSSHSTSLSAAASCAGDASATRRPRAQLTATWSSEPPEHRAALLPQLAVGLGPADEALLDTALDDRRKEVRALG